MVGVCWAVVVPAVLGAGVPAVRVVVPGGSGAAGPVAGQPGALGGPAGVPAGPPGVALGVPGALVGVSVAVLPVVLVAEQVAQRGVVRPGVPVGAGRWVE